MRIRVASLLVAAMAAAPSLPAANNQVLGWNNLGMHCMDSDYSVFSILPPYNTIHAQIIATNRLVTNGFTVTYQAVADPTGSSNTTSVGKSNFELYDVWLFGTNLPPDKGLLAWSMPGAGNVPQSMLFERTNSGVQVNWYRAEGIPITPYDNAGKKNPYPLMRLLARNASGTLVASNDIVLPVSDEMDCRKCHASGTQAEAMPAAGWVWSDNPERDYRLNILRLHDEQRDPGTWPAILAANGFNTQGLYRNVVADGKPVLCAKCHLSEALPGTGYAGVPPLTRAVHSLHAQVIDPSLGLALSNATHRAACYNCHPGSTTKCLRGAMGAAVAADGTLAMQCQSCHGSITAVGATNRVGWLDEPDCQSCHVGNATNATFRYTSSFLANGNVRNPIDLTFATDTNVPAPPYSLFRFSEGHGNLVCSACHGSTHAEFPSSHTNDNIRSIQVQGHVGMISECVACHQNPALSGGPHGMHIANDTWADPGGHGTSSGCPQCHGSDSRGTELSESKSSHVITTSRYGAKNFWRGYRIGCYTCHNGPSSTGSTTPWKPASIAGTSGTTPSGAPILLPFIARDTNSSPQALTVRVIGQPANGTVGITNWFATNYAAIYYPAPGFVGTDVFTYAAWNGYIDSALVTGTVTVTQGVFSVSAQAHVPPTYPAGWAAPFTVIATPSNIVATATYDWNFGDASAHSTNQYPTHRYSAPATYNWSVVSTVQSGSTSATVTNSGSIIIGPPVTLTAAAAGTALMVSWPQTSADALLEQSPAVVPTSWTVVTNAVVTGPGTLSVTLPNPATPSFFRLRKL